MLTAWQKNWENLWKSDIWKIDLMETEVSKINCTKNQQNLFVNLLCKTKKQYHKNLDIKNVLAKETQI